MLTFNENALNIAFEQALGYSAPFSEEDCQMVTSLVVIHARDISELTPFTNLNKLEIFASDIYDISVFEKVHNIEKLKILCSPVQDTHPINSLKKLEEIEVSFTLVKDIEPILALPNLTKAVFMGNPLSEASHEMIEKLKVEKILNKNRDTTYILNSSNRFLRATRMFFDLGYYLCCEEIKGEEIIVKPGVPVFTKRHCDYLSEEEVTKWVLLDFLATEKLTLESIFSEMIIENINEINIQDFSRIENFEFATVTDARRWVNNSKISTINKDNILKFIMNFSSLTFYKEPVEFFDKMNEEYNVVMPKIYVDVVTTFAFVLSNKRTYFKISHEHENLSPLLELVEFIFSYGSSETERITDINDNEIRPFEIAQDTSSGEIRLVINLANPNDHNIYVYDLHDESSSDSVYPLFEDYTDLLSNIVMIRLAGTNIQYNKNN